MLNKSKILTQTLGHQCACVGVASMSVLAEEALTLSYMTSHLLLQHSTDRNTHSKIRHPG